MSRYVYLTLYSVAWVTFLFFATFSKKLKRLFRERRGLLDRIKAIPPNPLWFHVASSGEFEQVIPILEAIKRLYPEQNIFLSFFSPTAKDAVALEVIRREKANKSIPWDYCDYSPFDFPSHCETFISKLRPMALIIIHRELWPEMIRAADTSGIPRFLFATRFSNAPGKGFRYFSMIYRGFSLIGTIDGSSAQRFLTEVPSVPSEALGDPRIDRVLERQARRKESNWVKKVEREKIVLLASVWPADFSALKPALSFLLNQAPDWNLVIVPHEPTEKALKQWEVWLRDQGKKAYRLSRNSAREPLSFPLLVDQVGLLAELYGVADIVFVGGSFKGRVHNVLEPAVYGCPILTGPYISNSWEALEISRERLGLFAARSPEDLIGLLRQLIESAALRADLGRKIQGYVTSKTGAGERYAKALMARLIPSD